MSEVKSIKVWLPGGETLDCTVAVEDGPPWKVTLTGSGPSLEGSGKDLFAALTALREKLDPTGVRLLCAAARQDVYPSGMSRDMGGGRKAYVTKFGMPARKGDLIDVLDYAAPETVASVAEQQSFHTSWIESLRQRA